MISYDQLKLACNLWLTTGYLPIVDHMFLIVQQQATSLIVDHIFLIAQQQATLPIVDHIFLIVQQQATLPIVDHIFLDET